MTAGTAIASANVPSSGRPRMRNPDPCTRGSVPPIEAWVDDDAAPHPLAVAFAADSVDAACAIGTEDNGKLQACVAALLNPKVAMIEGGGSQAHPREARRKHGISNLFDDERLFASFENSGLQGQRWVYRQKIVIEPCRNAMRTLLLLEFFEQCSGVGADRAAIFTAAAGLLALHKRTPHQPRRGERDDQQRSDGLPKRGHREAIKPVMPDCQSAEAKIPVCGRPDRRRNTRTTLCPSYRRFGRVASARSWFRASRPPPCSCTASRKHSRS